MTSRPSYDDFEERAIEAIEKAQRRHALVALLPLLIVIGLLIGLGITSAVFSVKGARSQSAASKADVERNAELTRQLTTLTRQAAQTQQENADSAVAFRNDSRRLQLAICSQIEAIARQVQLRVAPCPRVPIPRPFPSPAPSPSPS